MFCCFHQRFSDSSLIRLRITFSNDGCVIVLYGLPLQFSFFSRHNDDCVFVPLFCQILCKRAKNSHFFTTPSVTYLLLLCCALANKMSVGPITDLMVAYSEMGNILFLMMDRFISI